MLKMLKFSAIFKACFRSIVENQVPWFQYKIIYHTLDTKD